MPASSRIPAALPGALPFPQALRARLEGALEAHGAAYRPRTRNLSEAGAPLYTNRLLLETSPYLQQHAHNPVNWYPWGDEAFDTARELGRPVFVSIGYSTCHWCHVMEEESFDDPETAALLNAHFIAVKVDRETRPDVDALYMSALQAMGQGGGWPLNVWLTPERLPFYGGTYFPPDDGRGRTSLRRVLEMIHARYREDPESLASLARQLSAALARGLEGAAAAGGEPSGAMLRNAAASYAALADDQWGGLRQRIKFPSSLPVRFLLRFQRRSGETWALDLATLALEKMAAGGLRDQLGGGFHRYATDPRWLVPHFEKMLYDNALLAVAYLEAWQQTGREDFAQVTRETLDYVVREMTAAEGGFYSATDADSLGPEGRPEEGRFFTWTPAEVEAVVGSEAAAVVNAWFGVTPQGDLDGRSVLRTWESLDALAKRFALEPDALRARLEQARAALYAARARRTPPLRDDKILAEWNGLMISAFARAGLALARPDYVAAARRASDFVLTRMRADDRLQRVFHGDRAAGPAFAEDYAFLISGLLDVYEADPDPRWLREAIALQGVLDTHYADAGGGGYYRVAADHERLFAREKPGQDGAVPSANSVAAMNLLRLAAFTSEDAYAERAVRLFAALHAQIEQSPTAFGEMLLAIDFWLEGGKEVLLVRPHPDSDATPMLDVLRTTYLPNRIFALVAEGAQLEAHAALTPLLHDKRALDGKVTAYVCEDRMCRFPTSDPAVFGEQLRRVKALD
ncbi:MAG: thioredoxin domain-containing protein [Myxococcales bacterium]|nr:thioredoxin domain-containing protein [Myxococcales bacterium]